MYKYDKMCDFINNNGTLDDKVYDDLVSLYGIDDTFDGIMRILNDNDYKSDIYKKILNANSDNIVNRFLILRNKELVEHINLILSIYVYGFDEDATLAYKVDKIGAKDRTIKKLYDEYMVIRSRIFEYNMPLIDKALMGYSYRDNYEELYQEASIALLNAIDLYDESKGKFNNYALFAMRRAVNDHMYDLSMEVSVPAYRKKKYYAYIKYCNYNYNINHKMPSRQRIAKVLAISDKEIDFYNKMACYDNAISLNEVVKVDDEYLELSEVLTDDMDIRKMENDVIGIEKNDFIEDALSCLTDRQREVADCLYLSRDPMNISETAEYLGVTHQNITQINNQMISKIRKRIKE